MNKIKTLFFGSGEFAVPILKKLLELDYIDLKAVVTQPDKPVGRKQVLTPTPVGIAMNVILRSRLSADSEPQDDAKNIDVLKPEKLKLISEEIIEKYRPELIIVASYGQIIPPNIVHYPKYKCLNFHGSILPLYRGAVPVPMAILDGVSETGVTLQIMEEELDEGAIIAIEKYTIKKDETSESLMNRLAELSVEILDKDLLRWIAGEITPVDQDESSADGSQATYCYKSDLTKEKAEIISSTTVEEADRMIRAFYPWPIAWMKLRIKNEQLKILKVYKASIVADTELGIMNQELSDVLKIVRKGKRLFLILNNGILELQDIQLEGKNRGSAEDYLFLAD